MRGFAALPQEASAICDTLRFVLSLILVLAWMAGADLLAGEVKFDGSLGAPGALNGPNFLIPADRGRQVGGHLFHSFSDFHLSAGEVGSFQGPASVQNISPA
jgi:large exoprotein involved in heme utilization and adhesion